MKSRVDDVGRAARTALRTDRGAPGERRRIARRRHAGRRRLVDDHGADRDQRRAEAPADRARPRPLGARQPDHRRRARPADVRADVCGVQRCRAAHQGRAPRAASRRASTGRAQPVDTAGRVGHVRGRVTRRSTACTRPAPSRSTRFPSCSQLHENGFAVLRAGSQSALARRVDDDLTLLHHTAPEAWGLRARSKEQRFALELLLDPDVSVVALDGRAGTGKTLAGHRRRPRAGGRESPLRAPRRLPPAGAGRASRRRLPAGQARREARPVDVGDPRRDRRAHRSAQQPRRQPA